LGLTGTRQTHDTEAVWFHLRYQIPEIILITNETRYGTHSRCCSPTVIQTETYLYSCGSTLYTCSSIFLFRWQILFWKVLNKSHEYFFLNNFLAFFVPVLYCIGNRCSVQYRCWHIFHPPWTSPLESLWSLNWASLHGNFFSWLIMSLIYCGTHFLRFISSDSLAVLRWRKISFAFPYCLVLAIHLC
jgi:hypothetical protein